jgi:hypothetical protein
MCWAILKLSLFCFSSAGKPNRMSAVAVPSAFVAMLMVMALYEESTHQPPTCLRFQSKFSHLSFVG